MWQAGYWILGSFNGHLPGHYEYEDYEDSSSVLKRIHEDGNMVLNKSQAIDKFEALSQFHGADGARADQKMAVFFSKQSADS